MDKLAQEEEKKKVMDKIFACCMTPVTEWAAAWLDVEPNNIIKDYYDFTDKLAFTIPEQGCYLANLLVMPNDTPKCWDETLLKTEDAKKSASMLLDGVLMCWQALVSESTYKEELLGVRPDFVAETMSFRLVPVNKVALRWKVATEQHQQLEQKHIEISQLVMHSTNSEQTNEMLKDIGKIEELQKKAEEILDTCTEETNAAEEERIRSIEKKINEFDRLYLVCESVNDLSEDERFEDALERLPAMHANYRDPDEETEIDKLKKEINF